MSAVAVTRSDVRVAGVRSSVLSAGPVDSGEAVVCVHGNPGPAEDWRWLLGDVGGFVRVLAPDMPGFGQADRPRDFSYTVDGYARHLAGLLGELGVARAHLVLHDFGGPWGLAWAAAHPDAVASVTLVNTGAFTGGYRWHRLARIWRTPILGEIFWATTTRPAFRWLVSLENPRLPEAAIDALYRAYRGWPTRRAVLKLYRATSESSLGAPVPVLRGLDRAALVVWGTEDAYLPWSLAEHQREPFPRAEICLLEGLGHWPFHEDPARVSEVVVPFLQAQLAGAAAASTTAV